MPKDGKGLLPVDAMAAELAAQKSGRGRSKIYKEISDEHRAELVSADIRRKADALAEQKGRVELSDITKGKPSSTTTRRSRRPASTPTTAPCAVHWTSWPRSALRIAGLTE